MMCKSNFIQFYLFLFASSFAQERLPIYHDYLTDNYFLLHPSMAGAANCDKLRLTGRKQWLGQANTPELQTLSYSMRIFERSGIGVLLFNDKNGYHSQKAAKLTYAHHLLFSRDEIDLNQLSFGINVGFIQNHLDKSSFIDYDPIIANKLPRSSYLNFDAGLSYNYLDFYTHFTVQGIMTSRNKSFNDVDIYYLRNYLFSAGYVFGNKDTFYWEPSFLLQFTDKFNEKIIDTNIKIHKSLDKGSIWGGLSYRINMVKNEFKNAQKLHYFTPFIGLNFDNLLLGYTYSKFSGSILFEGAYHQITLGLNLFCRKEKYDCYCPAVN